MNCADLEPLLEMLNEMLEGQFVHFLKTNKTTKNSSISQEKKYGRKIQFYP